MFRVKRCKVRSIARLAARSPTLVRTRCVARYRPIIVDSLTYLFFAFQPETGQASLGTRALDDPGCEPDARKGEESKDTAHDSLRVVGCTNRRGFKGFEKGWGCRLDTANLSPLLVASDGGVLHGTSSPWSENFCLVLKYLTSAR